MSESEEFTGRLFSEARAVVAAGWGLPVIVATNLVPVFGVLFFEWGVFILLLLYWLENVIVGLFVALRLGKDGDVVAVGGQRLSGPFFLAHYGVFMAVHGMFVVGAFLEPMSLAGFVAAMGGWWWMIVAFGALFAEHAYAYHVDRVKAEQSGKTQGAGVGAAYVRLVIMHVTIIGGGFAAQSLGSPFWALLMLILLKTLFDVAAWIVKLPEAGLLGRIKKSFRAGLEVGMLCFVLSLVFVLPAVVHGSVISGILSAVAGRRTEFEVWILGYGFAAAGIITVLACSSAWLHEILADRPSRPRR